MTLKNSVIAPIFAILASTLAASPAFAQLYSSDLQTEITLADAVKSIPFGATVVIGENHGFKVDQKQQLEIMAELRRQGHVVAVGMEFLTYTDQLTVTDYQAGKITEAEFLSAVKWGSPSFDFYREQLLFPNLNEGASTWALNSPRGLTGAVAKNGLASLSQELQALLPPDFHLGRDSYKERFLKLMPHLPSPQAGENYFAAQSIWDDTMAWRAMIYKKAHPTQTLVIVVGEFHVQFGGGLPDRLKARGDLTVRTFSQVDSTDLSQDEKNELVAEKQFAESRAHYIWLAPLM